MKLAKKILESKKEVVSVDEAMDWPIKMKDSDAVLTKMSSTVSSWKGNTIGSEKYFETLLWAALTELKKQGSIK